MLVTDRKKKAEEITYFHTLLIVLSDVRIFAAAVSTVWTVLKDFFFMQSPLRPKRNRQPVVWIDHKYDKNIPFAPEWVEEYLHFIPLWVCSITWLRIRFGREGVRPVIDSLNEVKQLYKKAAEVYRKCQSTTVRPAPVKGNRHFAVIHATDPHLNCLPSLHVMLVTWAGYNLVNRIRELTQNDIAQDIEYIKHHAFLITESILYVKQHSVNCIPAALFVMKHLFPGFENEYGREFIANLFENSEPQIQNKSEVSSYMAWLLDYFNKVKSESGKDVTVVLLEYLLQYEKIGKLF